MQWPANKRVNDLFTQNDIDAILSMYEFICDAHGTRRHVPADKRTLNIIFDALRERIRRKTKLGRPRKQGGE